MSCVSVATLVTTMHHCITCVACLIVDVYWLLSASMCVTLGGGPQLTLIRAITDSDLSCWCDGMLIGREQPINDKAY
jgi:hypothetical protein